MALRCRLLGASLIAMMLAAPAQPLPTTMGRAEPETVDACLRLLSQSVHTQRDGSHLVLLSALRQLEDAALAPVFRRHATNSDPGIQVHAALGLAEIDDPRELLPSLVLSLPSPEARAIVVERGVNTGLITAARITELLAAESLEPLPRLWLLGKLFQDGQPMDQAMLVKLGENADIDIAGLAVWLLHETGHDSMRSGYEGRVAELSRSARHRHLREIFAAIHEYRLRAALPWVLTALEDSDLPQEARYEGVRAALALDGDAALEPWTSMLANDPSPAHAVRCALLLVITGPGAPAAAYDQLPTGDILLDRIVAVGRARATGSADVAGEMIKLIDVGHAMTAAWAVETAKELPPTEAARIYSHVVRTVEGDRRGRVERASLGVTAATRFFELDPDAAIGILSEVEDDSLTQEMLIIGLMGSSSPRAGEAAAALPRMGTGHADSMTLILITRHAQQLSSSDLHDLGTIAAGGGRVSQALQAQAAWLYLRHTGNTAQAIADLTSLE